MSRLTRTRLKYHWPVPYRIVRGLIFTVATAAYMTSFLATAAVTAIIAVLVLVVPTVMRRNLLYGKRSWPVQGGMDVGMREALIERHANDAIQGREFELDVIKGDVANAFCVYNKRKVKVIVTQTAYDWPVDQFFGVVLHEVGHARNNFLYNKSRILFGAILAPVMLAELLLAATGLGFLAALGWSSLMTLIEYVPFLAFMAWHRREEFACDAYAQTKGGDIHNGLVQVHGQASMQVGVDVTPKRLFGIESAFSTHPTLAERHEALRHVPKGTLDLGGYQEQLDETTKAVRKIMDDYVAMLDRIKVHYQHS